MTKYKVGNVVMIEKQADSSYYGKGIIKRIEDYGICVELIDSFHKGSIWTNELALTPFVE